MLNSFDEVAREWFHVSKAPFPVEVDSKSGIRHLRWYDRQEDILYVSHYRTLYAYEFKKESWLAKGKKFEDKIYYRHTGHPGGIKETTPEKLHEKKPGETLKLAVKRMLPGGVLGRKQLTKLKIYSGSDHPHSAQNPQVIELGKLNSKNLVRN